MGRRLISGHREMALVEYNQLRAMIVRGRRDEGIREARAVALTIFFPEGSA